MSDEMDDIIADFITEAEEILEKVDPLFIELETRGYDRDILNEIFRGMHTLKGASGFLGFQQIVDVAHRAESILKKLRDGETALSKGLMDVILKSVDTLRMLIFHIKLRDGVKEDLSAILGSLDDALDCAMKCGEPAPVADATADPACMAPAGKDDAASTRQNDGRKNVPENGSAPETVSRPVTAEVCPGLAQVTAGDHHRQPRKERGVVSTLRVDVSRIDKVMDLAGEIVLARNRLLNLSLRLDHMHSGDPNVESLIETTAFLDRVTSDLQLAVMKMRMQPLQKVFGKFPRMVRDLSGGLGKEIDLVISGEDTEVDKTVIENIGDPLVHIIRNSIDHGLEPPDERVRKGKPRKGTIGISAYQKGTQIVIEVTDDGKGIDVEGVKRKALKRGLISEEESVKMTDETAVNLIFLPGFSTKDVSTELSGRGVGMDVVKTNVAKLNGYAEVITKRDQGSTFRISLPLTLAIIQAMMVRVWNQLYAVPQSIIEETLRIGKGDLKDVTGRKVMLIRGRVLPVLRMTDLLGMVGDAEDVSDAYVLVASVGDRKFCVTVDELMGQEEIVIKSIDGINSEECGLLGATINGDGRVVLILDILALVRRSYAVSHRQ
ncbi:MAG TPA: chemotaxis protein CheA [Dissulfurispiraceae bacterium]|nr:chemotaxis protein CheA [Dissulfurispiraceae bacterium]